MTSKRQFLILFLIPIFAFDIYGQTTRIIVDPTKASPAIKATAAEEKLIKSLLPKVRRVWTKEICEENFSLTGVALGAFTKKGLLQKAFLYEFCQTGNGFANDGIVIIEAGEVVAHFIYEGAWAIDLAKLPDINDNGKDELLVTNFGGMHQGISAAGIDVVEFSDDSINEIGGTQTDYDDSGADENGKGGNAYSYKISVKTGANPVFYREKFVKKGKTRRRIGSIARAEMFKLDYKYEAVK